MLTAGFPSAHRKDRDPAGRDAAGGEQQFLPPEAIEKPKGQERVILMGSVPLPLCCRATETAP
jgi:hypothetical protein